VSDKWGVWAHGEVKEGRGVRAWYAARGRVEGVLRCVGLVGERSMQEVSRMRGLLCG